VNPEVFQMLSPFHKLAFVAALGGAIPGVGFAQTIPTACKTILGHMPATVQNGGPTMHRYCGRYANGGEYLVVAYSNHGGKYMAYTATQSDQNVAPAPATFRNGVLVWHSVIAGLTRTVVVTYLLSPGHMLTRIARGTVGSTIILKTDRLLRI
jgi:hypothetical protein